jgi:m7GpppX diphosphatase
MDFNTLINDANLKLIKKTNNVMIFNGQKNNNDIILLQKDVSCNDFNYNKCTHAVKVFENQRYHKFLADGKPEKIEFTIIYPALKADMRKYGNVKIIRYIETPEMYYTDILPKYIDQDLTWIYNIFNKKHEIENILYNDDKFAILPDLKWNGIDMNSIYCLAIFKDGSFRSIRDFTSDHIELLKHIDTVSRKVIYKKYGIKSSKIRSYFHYHPSFWHAHIHFNLIDNIIDSAVIDVSHLVQTIITNISIKHDYYQTVNLEVIGVEHIL